MTEKIDETMLEEERLYPQEEGETNDEWQNRAFAAEERHLACAAFKFLRIAYTFDVEHRHELLRILSVIAPDPEERETKARTERFYKTLEEAIKSFSALYAASKATPTYAKAGPCDCFGIPPGAPQNTRTIEITQAQFDAVRASLGDPLFAEIARALGWNWKVKVQDPEGAG